MFGPLTSVINWLERACTPEKRKVTKIITHLIFVRKKIRPKRKQILRMANFRALNFTLARDGEWPYKGVARTLAGPATGNDERER
jgi:hypothetical protein